MMAAMRRRVLIWGGASLAVGALVGLSVYFSRVGLDEADKLASVIGLFVAVVGLAISGYGLSTDRRGVERQPQALAQPQQPAAAEDDKDVSVDRDKAHTVRQRAAAGGQGRVYQAGRDQTINER